jgi:EF-hand domain pair
MGQAGSHSLEDMVASSNCKSSLMWFRVDGHKDMVCKPYGTAHCSSYVLTHTNRCFQPLVSAEEIQRLYKRFMKLDKDGSGSIDKEEFLAIPQIANNPLASRMIAIFDEDGGGDVDFKEFIKGLSAFSAKGNKREKLECEYGNRRVPLAKPCNQLHSRCTIWIEMVTFPMANSLLYSR